MITAMMLVGLASAIGKSGNGRFSRTVSVLSAGAASSSVAASRAWPKASIVPQRWMLATASRASTGVPSWNSSPSRNISVQSLPSASTL